MDQLAENNCSHFCYSPLITRGSDGRVELVTLLSLYTHHPWISWQSTDGHTSVPLHSSPVDQLAKYSWSHFCYCPVITRGSGDRAQLVTLLLLYSHDPWISWQSRAGYISVTLQSSPVDRLAKHCWSHFCYSPVITVCQLAEYTGHTSVTLYSTPVWQLALNSWSHFCYSPLITR